MNTDESLRLTAEPMVAPAVCGGLLPLCLMAHLLCRWPVLLKKDPICGYLCSSVFICGSEGFALRVTINGEEQHVPDGLTVSALLQQLALPTDRVAIERNRDILPRALWPATAVQSGDTFEIVTLVGGG